MTEEMVQKFDKKIVYVVHSMGNPILTHFLNIHVDKKWKEKHVKIWAAIAPVFMGAPKSLKSLISGENDGIPRILVGNIQMRGLLRTFPSTYFLVPSIPKEHPESWPEQFKESLYLHRNIYRNRKINFYSRLLGDFSIPRSDLNIESGPPAYF